MGKNNKKSGTKFVTLGERAYSFYDPSTGIQLVRGEKKALTARQLNSIKIRKALHNGHIVYVAEGADTTKQYSEDTVSNLVNRFMSMVDSGMEPNKIAKAFTDSDIDTIAKEYDLTRDEGETSVKVIESIISEIDNKNS